MLYDITHEESLILNFFNSDVYFVFENLEEVKSFLEYIKGYDPNFSANQHLFKRQAEMKSAAWIYSKALHRSQLEWDDGKDYFKRRYLMRPVSYSIVRNSAERETKLRNAFDIFISSMKNNTNQGETVNLNSETDRNPMQAQNKILQKILEWLEGREEKE